MPINKANSIMNIMPIKNRIVYVSAALFLTIPSIWDFHQQRYSTLKDSHTAMLNEESRLKHRKYEVVHEIQDLQHRLDLKHKQLDAISARLAALQNSIKDIERQM